MNFLISADFWEMASFIVTALGLPFAIFLFLYEQRKERDAEDEEAYQLLQNAYSDFLKIVLDNPDLQLRTTAKSSNLTDEQRERTLIIYEMLIALFERAYIVSYEEDLSGVALRRWNSWDDYMREWCRREDFYYLLPQLLRGEDPDFANYIRRVADEEHQGILVAR
ncbi:hypothetical protein RY831_16045 [Noviherbaspirillum sp. CPCC 100848]|uniref:DUF4760 domain-containing protein n=1 Tax=Noviherbaspirillum album TaxID=3080276 RepID=A0ABU6JAW3_9BURK|nr:hypothetical protein [Noviherbaspirillum sp. CPCC 100848]MEC4720675.1 hypothetical protein [Noviherbaspirillum sp. CPCC 100848]